MALKKERVQQGLPKMSHAELEYQAVSKWIAERSSKNGFAILGPLQISHYFPRTFYKRGHAKPIRLTTVDVQGDIEVTDSELFTEMLSSGLGPGKGFGCGMILLRPT